MYEKGFHKNVKADSKEKEGTIMAQNEKYTQAIDTGWRRPDYCYDIDGTKLSTSYGTDKTKSEYLASEECKLPELMVMNDGRPVTGDLWPQRRREILDITMEYGFGFTPEKPEKVDAEVLYSSADHLYARVLKSYAGKAVSERIMLSFDGPYGRFSFPIQFVRPVYVEKPPVLIHLAFNPSLRGQPVSSNVETIYAPVEEIIDNGFAYVHLCYNDIIEDKQQGDYQTGFVNNGMGSVFCKGETRGINEWGKVGMWAYGASRVVDYLLTRDDVDHDCISVAGNSRLGKTALWCGAQDERIFAALVNCSGFGGAGLMKVLNHKRLMDMVNNGSIDWWCERAKEYAEDATKLPYDAHFMVAAVAPRYINLVAADGDFPRYQLADFLSAAAASPAFEVQGLKGLVSDEELPKPTVVYNEGHIGFALRPGSHYFSRWDWNRHMEFVLKHRNEKK